ncbi:hypothetical protein Tco_0605882 [Tanacetum coccineum]
MEVFREKWENFVGGDNLEWLKFKKQELSSESQKEFRKKLSELSKKEIERPKALDIDEFSSLHEEIALQNLNQLYHEQIIREYVLEFLSSFTFREHIMELDNVDTMVFQLGGVRRSRHSGKEKVTLDDLFLLHSMDAGAWLDVPWHVAKFFTNKAKGYKKKSLIVGAHLIRKIARSYGLMTQRSLRSVTLGPETSLLSVAKLVDLGICRYNGLGLGEMVDDLPGDGGNEAAEAIERIGDTETNISNLSIEVDDLTYVVSGMSEQYDQFYNEFGQMRLEQQRFQTWNTDHLSQLLSFHHINHTHYDGTPYSYVPNIPDLGVQ